MKQYQCDHIVVIDLHPNWRLTLLNLWVEVLYCRLSRYLSVMYFHLFAVVVEMTDLEIPVDLTEHLLANPVFYNGLWKNL